MNYILITPLKNEEMNILKLRENILSQTMKPLAWVIVDSGSSDNTYELSIETFEDYKWVYVIKQKHFFEQGYGHLNFAQAINEGYNSIKKICIEKGLKFNYIGKTDATPILSKNYFDILISNMNKDDKLVITCGIQEIINHKNRIKINPKNNISLSGFNDIRLYKKEFFEEIGGYPLTPSPDSVLLIKAVKRGFNVKVIGETSFIKPRLGGSKIGIWNGSKLKGKYMYILGYHPVLIIMNSLQISRIIPPHYQFLPILWGFLLAILKRERRLSDKEVRDYYGKDRLNEIIKSLKG